MSKTKQLVIGAAVVTTITLASCSATSSIRLPGIGQVGGSGQNAAQTALANAKQVKVTTGSLENHIVATGQVSARQSADLAFLTSGTIIKINVKQGDQVKAGQVLATLDTSALELAAKQQQDAYLVAQSVYSQTLKGPTLASLKAARAAVSSAVAAYNNLNVVPADNSVAALHVALQNAQADLTMKQEAYNRAYSSNPAGIGGNPAALALEASTNAYNIAKANYDKAFEKPPAPQFSQAQASIAAAQANVDVLKPTQEAIDQAKIKLDQANDAWQQAASAIKNGTLLAPFDGLVSIVPSSVGDYVNVNTVVMSMADFAVPQFTMNVDEADMGNIKLGQNASVALQSYSGVHLPAKVVAIAPAGTSTGNVITFKVTLDLTKAPNQPQILLGMSGTAQVTTAKADNALVIPASLLVIDPKTQATSVNVLSADGSGSQSIPVTVGLRNSDTVEIVKGLNLGDTVLGLSRSAPVVQPGLPGGRGFGG